MKSAPEVQRQAGAGWPRLSARLQSAAPAALILTAVLPWHALPMPHRGWAINAGYGALSSSTFSPSPLSMLLLFVISWTTAMLQRRHPAGTTGERLFLDAGAAARAGLLVLAANFTWLIGLAAEHAPLANNALRILLLACAIGLWLLHRSSLDASAVAGSQGSEELRSASYLALLLALQPALGVLVHYVGAWPISPDWLQAGLLDMGRLLAMLWLCREVSRIAMDDRVAGGTICRDIDGTAAPAIDGVATPAMGQAQSRRPRVTVSA